MASYVLGLNLKWRRERGLECASCLWFIHAADLDYKSMSNNDLPTHLQERVNQDEYDEKLKAWEA